MKCETQFVCAVCLNRTVQEISSAQTSCVPFFFVVVVVAGERLQPVCSRGAKHPSRGLMASRCCQMIMEGSVHSPGPGHANV